MTIGEFFDKVQAKIPDGFLMEIIQTQLESVNSIDKNFPPSQVEAMYEFCWHSFQGWGMSMTNGEESHDTAVWGDTNRHLAVVRDVLNEEFHADLPEIVVRSITEEMVREGFLKVSENSQGNKTVALEDNPYDVRVRIVTTPPGGAPETVRQEWIGVEFKARYIPGLHPVRDFVSKKLKSVDGLYMVPGHVAVEALSKRSSEAAQWFIDNTDLDTQYMFHADCVETINTQ